MHETTKEKWEENMRIALANYQSQYGDKIAGELEPELLEIDFERKEVLYRFFPDSRCKNQWDVVHGGVLATLFDSCMGITSRSYAGVLTTPTVNLNITYLIPHVTDKYMYIRVHLNSCGGRLASLTSWSWQDNEDTRCAVAQGTFYLMQDSMRLV